jgi:hypothetical protein
VAIEKHHGTRKGKLTAEKAGTYWLVWDNTYSILKGKSVEYQVQYPPPPTLPHALSSGRSIGIACQKMSFLTTVPPIHRLYGAGLHQRRHRRRRRRCGVNGGPFSSPGDVRVVLGHHDRGVGGGYFSSSVQPPAGETLPPSHHHARRLPRAPGGGATGVWGKRSHPWREGSRGATSAASRRRP